jgi:fibronectin type 3 domain-containing protein
MLVALAIAAAFFAGCGSSSSPSAPVDTVAPAAVLDVDAQYVQGVIEVSWTGGAEADLVGYRVYRSTNGAAPTLVGFETTTTYVDGLIAVRNSYRYEVTAVDQVGNESARTATTQVFVQGATPGRGDLSSD